MKTLLTYQAFLILSRRNQIACTTLLVTLPCEHTLHLDILFSVLASRLPRCLACWHAAWPDPTAPSAATAALPASQTSAFGWYLAQTSRGHVALR